MRIRFLFRACASHGIRLATISGALVFCVFATPAAAYVGPGLGAGAVAVVLGLLGALLMAIVAVVWYPIKRFRRKRQNLKDNGDPATRE